MEISFGSNKALDVALELLWADFNVWDSIHVGHCTEPPFWGETKGTKRAVKHLLQSECPHGIIFGMQVPLFHSLRQIGHSIIIN